MSYCNKCFNYMEESKKCGRCEIPLYCSKKCQNEDWKNHKKVCSVICKNKSIGGKPVFQEAFEINLFSEINGLKKHLHGDFQMGRYLVLEGVKKFIDFDPINGDMKEYMTEDDKKYWEEAYDDIIEGAKYLSNGGKEDMRDPLVWSFIPRRLKHNVENRFNGIGENIENI